MNNTSTYTRTLPYTDDLQLDYDSLDYEPTSPTEEFLTIVTTDETEYYDDTFYPSRHPSTNYPSPN